MPILLSCQIISISAQANSLTKLKQKQTKNARKSTPFKINWLAKKMSHHTALYTSPQATLTVIKTSTYKLSKKLLHIYSLKAEGTKLAETSCGQAGGDNSRCNRRIHSAESALSVLLLSWTAFHYTSL